jgi:WD40 repeat protein
MVRQRSWFVGCVVAGLIMVSPISAQPTNYTEVTALVFSVDGKQLLSTALNGQIAVWDVVSGAKRRDVQAHKDGVYAAALSKDGKHLFTAGADGLVKQWDAESFKEVRIFEGHRNEVLAVAVAPDGKTLVSGGVDKTIRVWDLVTGKQKYAVHGHELRVTALAFGPDGKTFASGGTCSAVVPGFFGGTIHADQVRLYATADGRELRKLEQHGTVLAFSSDGKTIAAGGMHIFGMPVGQGVSIHGGPRVQVGQATSGRELFSFKGQGSAVALSADGKFLASAWGSRQHLGRYMIENDTKHRRVSLWELGSGKEVLQLAEEGATVAAISPDGRRLAAGRYNGAVMFWDLTPPGWNTAERLKMLDAKDLERHWETLLGDAQPAYPTILTLIAAGDRTAADFKPRLKPSLAAGPEVAKLIADLDSAKYPVREAAFRDLKKLGAVIEPNLRQTLEGKVSPEVRKRLQALLDQWDRHPANAEELRQWRALLILERIGSEPAQAVLAQLAGGAPGAWLTVEAQSSIERLAGRTNGRTEPPQPKTE